ncbi:MAG: type II secretion system protein [Spartobacteria bacterium]|nr:type II secretion system protein [Spartobacteria bacterium]
MRTENQRRKTVRARAAFTLIELLACQPKPWRRQVRAAFTLIELLVVLAILGILMAMMIPAAGLVMKQMAKARARSDAGIVATVLLKYQAEYNRWPEAYRITGEGTADKVWVDMMAPAPENWDKDNNFKRITFFEPGGGALAPAKKPDGTPHPHAGAFVDPWGMPFMFLLDVVGAGELVDPDESEGGVVRGRVLVWSAGPDNDYITWEDNVKGWE